MNIELLAFARLRREKFTMESITPENDMLILVKSGSFRFTQENEEYTVEENQAALLRAGILCKRKIITPSVFYIFRYKSDEVIFKGSKISFQGSERVRLNMEMLDAAHGEPELAWVRTHVLADLAIIHALSCRTVSDKSGGGSDELIERVISEMKRDISRKISLTHYANLVGISYVQFIRRFEAYTKKSPSAYLNELRMELAKSLLSESELLIKEISAHCGFENEYYFSNRFKKYAGIAPTEYRKMF